MLREEGSEEAIVDVDGDPTTRFVDQLTCPAAKVEGVQEARGGMDRRIDDAVVGRDVVAVADRE